MECPYNKVIAIETENGSKKNQILLTFFVSRVLFSGGSNIPHMG